MTRPDIDKIARAILDSATFAGVIRDDAQVVELHAIKTFPNEHPAALEVPGVHIKIETIRDHTAPAIAPDLTMDELHAMTPADVAQADRAGILDVHLPDIDHGTAEIPW